LVVMRACEFVRNGQACPQDGKTGAQGGGPAVQSDTFDQACLVPISVSVRLQESTRAALEKTYGRVPGDATRPLRVELIGRMPSSLPDHWRKCAPR
jgi:hypothetical protein